MRKILFRGKRTDNKQWVEGYFIMDDMDNPNPYIVNGRGKYRVSHATVGQYTGLTDTNGKRIFEGDIIKSYQGKILAVKFGQYRDDEECVSGNGWHVSGEYGTLSFDERWGGHEVVGNKWDNPELLGCSRMDLEGEG